MKKTVFVPGIIILSLLLLLTACKQSGAVISASPQPGSDAQQSAAPQSDSPSVSQSPSETPATPTPASEPACINPLTGLELDPAYQNKRPVVIMINNIKQALPQFGLLNADIIYEVVAEGGITRLVAVMQNPSKAGIIGSVRSTRSYYLDIAQGHDGLLLHAGASDMAYTDIKVRGVTSLDAIRGGYEGSLYYRDKGRIKNNGLEHSLMTTGENIVNVIKKASFRTDHKEGYKYPVSFARDVVLEGKAAEDITVKMSQYKTGQFKYDTKTGRYLVFQYGKQHMDAAAGEQLSVKNVLVLYADISSIKGDKYGRMQVDLVGGGNGIYICGGKTVDIRWTKDSYTSPFTYTNPDGTERVFNEGTSYICIVSSAKSVTIK